MVVTIIFLVAIQAVDKQTAVEGSIWKQTPLKKVTEIELPPSVLGDKWKISPGLKIDDLSTLSDVPVTSRQAARNVAKQLKPFGVCSVADYSLVVTEIPFNTVTVKVFVFDNAMKCKAWWIKNYEYDGWEKHYLKVDSDIARVVRSTQMNKTCMAFGNVWLTTHQLRKGDDHIKAANHVLKLLTNDSKSLTQVSAEASSDNQTVPKTPND